MMTPEEAPGTGISLKTWMHLIYAFQAAYFVVGFTLLLAVILAYVKREDMVGTWMESHIRWQISTFWYWLLFTLVCLPVGWLLLVVGIGYLILLLPSLWLRTASSKAGWPWPRTNPCTGRFRADLPETKSIISSREDAKKSKKSKVEPLARSRSSLEHAENAEKINNIHQKTKIISFGYPQL